MVSCRLSLFTINLFIWSAFGLLSCYVYGPTFITNFCTILTFIEANTHLMLQYLFHTGLFILSVTVITKIALGSDLKESDPPSLQRALLLLLLSGTPLYSSHIWV